MEMLDPSLRDNEVPHLGETLHMNYYGLRGFL
jgi:hypothetical protein